MTTIPAGWKLAPIEPTEAMIVCGFESRPDPVFSKPEEWEAFDAMTGCQQAAHKARLCYAAMLAAAPTPPASAQPERDWELTCDHCNGAGFVYVERQVAERKSDVQEFKEDCEECEGRGFTIAFEDIPGIEAYVKSRRPAPASAQDDAKDERQAFEAWAKKKKMPLARVGQQYDDFWVDHAWNGWQARASVAAPAAGDARDAARLDWLEQHDGRFYNKDRISSIVGTGFLVAGDEHGVRHQTVRAAIDAAIAAQRQGDA